MRSKKIKLKQSRTVIYSRIFQKRPSSPPGLFGCVWWISSYKRRLRV